MKHLRALVLCLVTGAVIPSFFAAPEPQRPLRVVTTLPDLAWIVSRVGGAETSVEALLSGREDPHFVEARPDFVLKVAKAEVVCFAGLDLEIGWLPKVLSRSANKSVQPGGAGYCDAGRRVTTVDKPSGPIDRAHGDVHPKGNPHYNLSPRGLREAAEAVRESLVRARPAFKTQFETGHAALVSELSALEAKIKAELAALPKGAAFFEYHKDFAYFFESFGLRSVGSLEEKPGVSPSAARIATVALEAKTVSAVALLASMHHSPRITSRFQELSGRPVLRLPTYVSPADGVADPPALLRRISRSILEAVAKDGASK